ncbi:MAG: GLUG motif-containing protein [Bacillota bacterium]|nr:GLUG motif-containing protein [Bacillota bacterium]
MTDNKPFCGYFNGNGKTVSGMIVDQQNDKYCGGFFGNILCSNSSINCGVVNLTIKNGSIYNNGTGLNETNNGLLVGFVMTNSGCTVKFDNIVVSRGLIQIDGLANYGNIAGGMLGNVNRIKVSNCMVENVQISGVDNSGGFVGMDSGSIYENCTATGKITGNWALGGFVGYALDNDNGKLLSTYKHCLADVEITANDWNAGGFIGFAQNATIQNCIAKGNVTSTVSEWEPKVGTFAGTLESSNVENSHAAGKVSGISSKYELGGYTGYIEGNTILKDCSFDKTLNPELKSVGGDEPRDIDGVSKVETNQLKANICEDYDGKHHAVKVNGQSATCTEDGFEEYWKCEDCGLMYSDSNMTNSISEPIVIKATGHKFGNWQIVREATENQEGEKKRVCEVCKYEETEKISKLLPSSEQVNYKILDGADSSWLQDTHKDLVIRGNGEFSKFKCVKVDGTVVDAKNYTVSEGSTIVTLKEDYLKTLTAGKHTFEIVWNDGLASTTFTVVKGASNDSNLEQVTGNKNESTTVKQDNKNSTVAKTGDTSNFVLYGALLMISFVGLFVTITRKKLNRK